MGDSKRYVITYTGPKNNDLEQQVQRVFRKYDEHDIRRETAGYEALTKKGEMIYIVPESKMQAIRPFLLQLNVYR